MILFGISQNDHGFYCHLYILAHATCFYIRLLTQIDILAHATPPPPLKLF